MEIIRKTGVWSSENSLAVNSRRLCYVLREAQMFHSMCCKWWYTYKTPGPIPSQVVHFYVPYSCTWRRLTWNCDCGHAKVEECMSLFLVLEAFLFFIYSFYCCAG
jgi:hypothetical protein